MSHPITHKTSTTFLDGLRGLAALYVMIGHARWLLWEGYSEGFQRHPQLYSSINRLLMYFFSLFKFGHEAVLFFFLLSGFLIHLKYARNKRILQTPGFILSEYILKRIKRIYPPFLAALLLTFTFDSIGRSLGYLIYSGQTPYYLININIGNKSLSLQTLIGNILFLFQNYFPLFGTNTPTWSLKFEWWFYLIYPFFLLVSKKNVYTSTLLMVALFCLSFFPGLWPETLLPEIFSMMICWWLGVLLAETYEGLLKVKFSILRSLTLFFILCPYVGKVSSILYDVNIAIGFMGFLSLFFWMQQKGMAFSWLEKLKVLGGFSYTLYVIHFPLLVFLSGWIMFHHNNVLPIHFGYVIAAIPVISFIAYALHFITEVPFIKKKKTALSFVSGKML